MRSHHTCSCIIRDVGVTWWHVVAYTALVVWRSSHTISDVNIKITDVISQAQQTGDVDPMLNECWAGVANGKSALNKH